MMPRSVGQIDVVYPHENKFACMLGKVSKGPCEAPLPSKVISEPFWTIEELKRAIRRLKHDNWRRGWVDSGTVEACSARILDALWSMVNPVRPIGQPVSGRGAEM